MNLKTLTPHLAALVIFLITSFVIFGPEFQNKTLRRGDIMAYQGAAEEMHTYGREYDRRMNWTGTSFAGMPTYQISNIHQGNQLIRVAPVLRGFMSGGAGAFFAGMLCAYLLLIVVGVSPWLSIAGAVGIALATNNIVLWKAGHATKVYTVMYLPLIAAGILTAFNRKYLFGGLLFALGMGLAIFVNHPQMLYYFGMTIPLFGLAKLVQAVRQKQLPHFAKATGALLVGLVLAIGAGANNLLPTQEYAAATMRGGQVLENPVASSAGSAKSGNGLDWEYAMGWSNGFKDMVATYAPLAAGGGGATEVSTKTEFGKALKRVIPNLPATFGAPMYHGALPFTEGPSYLGAVAWALFLFGLFNARKPVAIWLGAGTLLILMVSAGKNAEGFNRLLYDNLPLLNKFRTPNSALSISAFMMLALGMLGLHNWLRVLDREPEKARTRLLYSGITAAALGAFIAILLPAFLDFSSPNDAATLERFTGGQGDIAPLLDGLEATRRALYASDAWRSFLYVGLTFGTLFLLYRKTIGPLIAGLLLTGLLAFDYGGINGRYLDKRDWVPERSVRTPYPKTAADDQILQDTDIHYRVFNLTARSGPFNDAGTSYYHRSVGGYSAVKMRRYQDIIDGYLSKQNMNVLNMLNTKYFIIPGQDKQPAVRRNAGAFGPAWLVSNVKRVTTNDAEFAALGEEPDLKSTAIVHEEFAEAVAGLQPSGQGSVRITEYIPDEMTYSFDSPSEQLVVFSEVWYGPDLGWEAYIDGQPADLIRTNYLLRGLRVPAGQHELKMVFAPKAYATGTTISLVSSLLILLGIAGYLAYLFMQRRAARNTAVPVEELKRPAPRKQR